MEDNLQADHAKIVTPSGYNIEIREQNGNDEVILSTMSGVRNGTNISGFVANIIISQDIKPGSKLGIDDISKLGISDKYYIALKSRINSIGNELLFKNTCNNANCSKITEYVEDLLNYDYAVGDNPFDEYANYRVKSYPQGKTSIIDLTLSSGKQIKYSILTSLGEQKSLQGNPENMNTTSPLIARELKVLNETSGQYDLVFDFRNFTAREMKQIRESIAANDLQFTITSKITCPHCGTSEEIPLIYVPGFFFPSAL